jgi:hypothetical protein
MERVLCPMPVRVRPGPARVAARPAIVRRTEEARADRALRRRRGRFFARCFTDVLGGPRHALASSVRMSSALALAPLTSRRRRASPRAVTTPASLPAPVPAVAAALGIWASAVCGPAPRLSNGREDPALRSRPKASGHLNSRRRRHIISTRKTGVLTSVLGVLPEERLSGMAPPDCPRAAGRHPTTRGHSRGIPRRSNHPSTGVSANHEAASPARPRDRQAARGRA